MNRKPEERLTLFIQRWIVTSACRQTHRLSIQKEKVLHFPTKHREKLVILRDRGMIGPDRPLSLSSTCTCQGPFSSSNICHIIKHKSGGNVSKPAEGKANALPSSAASSTPELQCHRQINPGHWLGLQHGLECWFLVILATACSEAVIFCHKEERCYHPFRLLSTPGDKDRRASPPPHSFRRCQHRETACWSKKVSWLTSSWEISRKFSLGSTEYPWLDALASPLPSVINTTLVSI